MLQKILTWKVLSPQEWVLQGFNHHGTNDINKDDHIGTWAVPVLGLASDLKAMMLKIQGDKKQGWWTKNAEMRVLRSLALEHILLAGERKKQREETVA